MKLLTMNMIIYKWTKRKKNLIWPLKKLFYHNFSFRTKEKSIFLDEKEKS